MDHHINRGWGSVRPAWPERARGNQRARAKTTSSSSRSRPPSKDHSSNPPPGMCSSRAIHVVGVGGNQAQSKVAGSEQNKREPEGGMGNVRGA